MANKMKLSILTLLFRRYELEKTFEICSALGYDGIEIWGARPHAYPLDMDEEAIENVLRLEEKYRLPVSMYTPEVIGYKYNLLDQNPDVREQTVEYLKKALDVAAGIKTERMQITCGHPGHNTNRRQNYRNLVEEVKKLADHAERVGVKIVVEALTLQESNMIVLCDDLVELIEDVGSPNVVGMIDTVTPRFHWEPISDYFDKLGNNMDYVHFVDNNGSGHRHMQFGDGDIYLEECIRVFRKYDYEGWLSVELTYPTYEPEMFASQAITRLKKIVENGYALPLKKFD